MNRAGGEEVHDAVDFRIERVGRLVKRHDGDSPSGGNDGGREANAYAETCLCTRYSSVRVHPVFAGGEARWDSRCRVGAEEDLKAARRG